MAQALRVITLLLSLVGIATWLLWGVKHPDKRGHIVGPLTWLVMVAMFSITLIMYEFCGIPINAIFFNRWSTVIRWLAIILLIGFGWMFAVNNKHKTKLPRGES